MEENQHHHIIKKIDSPIIKSFKNKIRKKLLKNIYIFFDLYFPNVKYSSYYGTNILSNLNRYTGDLIFIWQRIFTISYYRPFDCDEELKNQPIFFKNNSLPKPLKIWSVSSIISHLSKDEENHISLQSQLQNMMRDITNYNITFSVNLNSALERLILQTI